MYRRMKNVKNKVLGIKKNRDAKNTGDGAPKNTGRRGFLPTRIFLVRNGETELRASSLDLNEVGRNQANNDRVAIRQILSEMEARTSWKLSFYVSPHLVAQSTFRLMGFGFGIDKIVAAREDPRLRDHNRAPADNGELLNIYDRISGFYDSLRMEMMNNEVEDLNLIIISHTVPINLFLMKEFNWTVEEVSGLSTTHGTRVQVLELGNGGKYSLCVHHSDREMRNWGFSEEMIRRQHLCESAVVGDLQTNCSWNVRDAGFFYNVSGV